MLSDERIALYDVETAVEEAVRAVFQTYSLNPYTRKNAPQLKTQVERVELRFRLGETTQHFTEDKQGVLRHDSWTGTLTVQLFTKSAPNDDAHPKKRATIRALLADIQTLLNDPAILPLHSINDVSVDTGTSPALKLEDGFELSSLNFNLAVCIRPDAWPEE